MDVMLVLFMLLCSSGLQAEGKHNSAEPDDVRLVGGASRCAGTLEIKHQGDWRPGDDMYFDWTLKTAAVVCRQLGCGSAVSTDRREDSSDRSVWWIRPDCHQLGSTLRECVETRSDASSSNLQIVCSESVRLVNGNSLCSGRVEVKSNQSWTSVCEADFDQQDAEVVCRELGCGAPSVFQGALYGEAEAPMWTREFQCEGSESVLLDCGSSGTVRNKCSPGDAVGLTCSEPGDVRLAGGASNCSGRLEVEYHGDWRPAYDWYWNLKAAAAVCRQLDCGSAASTDRREDSSDRSVFWVSPDCLQSGSTLRECLALRPDTSSSSLQITCSESVRLVNGNSLCSGRVEVKSNQSWSSVCEADFDQQDAEVVCRELGCGAPSVFQGALYGEAEASVWTREFQCEGSESVLLDCGTSGTVRNTCSPGDAVGLTCSEPDDVRLVGASRCAGRLEVKHQGDWRPVDDSHYEWILKAVDAVCRKLGCGVAVSTERKKDSSVKSVWWIRPNCHQTGSTLRECVETKSESSSFSLQITCSESVRLVNGNSLCSGRVEVKSNQSWSSVCEADFDQQDAEVVCRELSCGAPSVFQGALYGEAEASAWTKEFQCEGSESVLQKCRRSGTVRNTCSPGDAVGLTCSEPDDVRLGGGRGRCAGTVEVKHQADWRPVYDRYFDWNLKAAAVVCRQLDCGSAVSTERREDSTEQTVLDVGARCDGSHSALRECVVKMNLHDTFSRLEVICSDLLGQPIISLSSSVDGGLQVLRGSSFSISCSIQSHYPGGSFQLTLTSSNTTHTHTLPAVNYTAHFLFPAAEPTHQGRYICVYHINISSHHFSSESQPLSLTVSGNLSLKLKPAAHVTVLTDGDASAADFIIRLVVLPVVMVSLTTALYFYCKVRPPRGGSQEETRALSRIMIALIGPVLKVCRGKRQ
ncbi:scavenger receptor cysteine-rich type 1 protein M160-like [Myripristis murdjan]|uniref:scavenger receptor cysteine-rich type 1 protein M160-like n=1 Tax=Myripristis murdjan TaxID=586833 RepID=UPI001176306B|nr:scavenger receptor cysteine-rich type 1 protein M160-like [Myripristis murdjan]